MIGKGVLSHRVNGSFCFSFSNKTFTAVVIPPQPALMTQFCLKPQVQYRHLWVFPYLPSCNSGWFAGQPTCWAVTGTTEAQACAPHFWLCDCGCLYLTGSWCGNKTVSYCCTRLGETSPVNFQFLQMNSEATSWFDDPINQVEMMGGCLSQSISSRHEEMLIFLRKSRVKLNLKHSVHLQAFIFEEGEFKLEPQLEGWLGNGGSVIWKEIGRALNVLVSNV